MCDLMENNEKEIEISDNKVYIDFKNFEIITLKAEY